METKAVDQLPRKLPFLPHVALVEDPAQGVKLDTLYSTYAIPGPHIPVVIIGMPVIPGSQQINQEFPYGQIAQNVFHFPHKDLKNPNQEVWRDIREFLETEKRYYGFIPDLSNAIVLTPDIDAINMLAACFITGAIPVDKINLFSRGEIMGVVNNMLAHPIGGKSLTYKSPESVTLNSNPEKALRELHLYLRRVIRLSGLSAQDEDQRAEAAAVVNETPSLSRQRRRAN